MKLIIILSCFIILIAEIVAIRFININVKVTSVKDVVICSLFPLIISLRSYINLYQRKNDKFNSDLERIQTILYASDSEFDNSDIYEHIKEIIKDDNCIINKELSLKIKQGVNSFYEELIKQLPNSLNDNEKYVIILLHIGVPPKKIGNILFLSYETVRTYKMRAKLKINDNLIRILRI